MVTPGPGSLTMYRKPLTVRSNSSVPGTRLWTCTKWARTTIDSPVVVLVHTSRGAETNSVKRVTFPSGSRNTVNRSETVPATCASNVPQSTVNSKLSFDAWTKWSGGLAEALPAARTEQADTASTAVSRRDFMGGPFLGGNSHATRSTALPRASSLPPRPVDGINIRPKQRRTVARAWAAEIHAARTRFARPPGHGRGRRMGAGVP